MGEDEVPELPVCGRRRIWSRVRGHGGREPGCIDRDCDLIMRVEDCASRWIADGGCEIEAEDAIGLISHRRGSCEGVDQDPSE
jgi:hypothetical protein